ncbi:MAG TPA: DUF6717 family protein, partial [Flavisolibacter sp.]|nr:DUF6717 family protein [Flavisolibacter sp.]
MMQQTTKKAEVYTFEREEGRWYIGLDAYLSHGWSRQDLELKEGAPKILNMFSNGGNQLRLHLSAEGFDGAN